MERSQVRIQRRPYTRAGVAETGANRCSASARATSNDGRNVGPDCSARTGIVRVGTARERLSLSGLPMARRDDIPTRGTLQSPNSISSASPPFDIPETGQSEVFCDGICSGAMASSPRHADTKHRGASWPGMSVGRRDVGAQTRKRRLGFYVESGSIRRLPGQPSPRDSLTRHQPGARYFALT